MPGAWADLGDPQVGLGGLGLAQEIARHSNAQYSDLYPKPGSIREDKTAYMVKPYGTLSEYES